MYLTDFCTVGEDTLLTPQIWGRQVIESYMKRKGKVHGYLANVQSSKRTIKDSYVLKGFFEDLPKEYDAYEKDIAVLNVFFDSTTVMLFKSQRRQSWLDYFSAVGGALGVNFTNILCSAFLPIFFHQKISKPNCN